MPAHLAENVDAVQNALYGAEVRDVENAFTPAVLRFRIRLVQRAVYEIVDDLDRILNTEKVDRTPAHVLADGGDAIGALDRKFVIGK